MTLVTLTARRLSPGAWDGFRAAWDPGVSRAAELGWTRIYHARDLADPDVVLSFGFFEGSVERLRESQVELGRDAQVDRITPHVAEVLLDGSFEVVEELEP